MYLAGLHVSNAIMRVSMSPVIGTISIPLIIWLLYLDILCLSSGLHNRFNECLGGSVA